MPAAADRAAILAGTLEGLLAELRFPLPERSEREVYHLVCAYVEELKALGFPPERVIIAVKRAANEAGVFSTPRLIEPRAQLDGNDKLLVDMVRWSIEQYYGRRRREADATGGMAAYRSR